MDKTTTFLLDLIGVLLATIVMCLSAYTCAAGLGEAVALGKAGVFLFAFPFMLATTIGACMVYHSAVSLCKPLNP